MTRPTSTVGESKAKDATWAKTASRGAIASRKFVLPRAVPCSSAKPRGRTTSSATGTRATSTVAGPSPPRARKVGDAEPCATARAACARRARARPLGSIGKRTGPRPTSIAADRSLRPVYSANGASCRPIANRRRVVVGAAWGLRRSMAKRTGPRPTSIAVVAGIRPARAARLARAIPTAPRSDVPTTDIVRRAEVACRTSAVTRVVEAKSGVRPPCTRAAARRRPCLEFQAYG